MAINIFLGYPSENIKNWIINNCGSKDMTTVPLHFTAEQDGSIVSLDCYDEVDEMKYDSWCEFEYSMTGRDNDWSDYTAGYVINLNKDETVYFRAKQGNVKENPNLNGFHKTVTDVIEDEECSVYHQFKIKGSVKAGGNIQFLLENTGTKMDVPYLCYCHMFQNCTSLTQAPILPAETLADWCYYYMFNNCTSLTNAYFPNIDSDTVINEVVGTQEAFYDAANNIEVTCKDGILVINSTEA